MTIDPIAFGFTLGVVFTLGTLAIAFWPSLGIAKECLKDD